MDQIYKFIKMLVLSLDEPVLDRLTARACTSREGSRQKARKELPSQKIQARNVILKKWRLATKSVKPNTSSFAEFQ
jgi:hypothetical protein